MAIRIDFQKSGELSSCTFKDLILVRPSSLPSALRQNLDKQTKSFHIQITFCYQLTFEM